MSLSTGTFKTTIAFVIPTSVFVYIATREGRNRKQIKITTKTFYVISSFFLKLFQGEK